MRSVVLPATRFPSRLPPDVSQERLAPLALLIVDEDEDRLRQSSVVAAQLDFAVHTADSQLQARAVLKALPVAVIFVTLGMSRDQGFLLFHEVSTLHPETAIIISYPPALEASASEGLRQGAVASLPAPYTSSQLSRLLSQVQVVRYAEIRRLRKQQTLRNRVGHNEIVGNTIVMQGLSRQIARAAASSNALLVLGEHGTGKDLVARTIHRGSTRASRPFIRIDCEADSTSVEEQLFGMNNRTRHGLVSEDGMFQSAEGTTILLHQISELSGTLQRLLTERLRELDSAARTSSLRTPKDRLIASSSEQLGTMVHRGRFSKELFSRFNLMTLRVPPLRERIADVSLLANHFVEGLNRQRRSHVRLSDHASQLLTQYQWPANVAELRIVVERAYERAGSQVIEGVDLPQDLQQSRTHTSEASGGQQVTALPSFTSGNAAQLSMAEIEKQSILKALREVGGDKQEAARRLGIGKTTLYRKLKEYADQEQNGGL